MAGFEIDTSEMRQLGVDLGKIPSRLIPEGEAVLKKGAQNLKGAMAAEFEKSDHFSTRSGQAPPISYDRIGFAREIAYEIGPEMHGHGALAHIAVDGGANGGGGSVDIDQLLEPEAAQIEKFLGKTLEGLL
jgi:hypothetical protein